MILYDGVCGLCNRTITLVLPRDPGARFCFASLQSETGRSLLRKHGRNPDMLDTFFVIRNYRGSNPQLVAGARAALLIAGGLGGVWRGLPLLGILPDFILDGLYSLVARHRYRIFGRYDQCLIPTPDYRNRFIDV